MYMMNVNEADVETSCFGKQILKVGWLLTV